MRHWLRGALLACLLAAGTVAHAQDHNAPDNDAQDSAMQDSAADDPQGDPVAAAVVRDPEFGVTTRQLGLERKVEMLQWRRSGEGYEAAWSAAPIDSSHFDAAHRNPADFPLRTRYWIGSDIRIDGKPLDEDVLKVLGQWHAMRPNFSALPGNMSATFQPEGDGLGSAENPLRPQIGDLRIAWRELVLPSLDGRIAQQSGVWVLREDAVPAAAGDATQSGQSVPASAVRRNAWPIGVCIVVVLIAVLSARRRARRRS